MNIILPKPKEGELYRCVLQELPYPPKDKLVAAYLGLGICFCYEIEKACRFCGITLDILIGLQYDRSHVWERLQGEGFSGEILIVQPVKPFFDESLPHPFYRWVDDGTPIRVISMEDLKALFSFCLDHRLHPRNVTTLDGQVVPADSRNHCIAMMAAFFQGDISLMYETRILFDKIDADLRFLTMDIFRRTNGVKESEPLSKKVYVLGDLDRGVIKIGISENVSNRVLGVQTGYPYPLTILWSSSRAKKNAQKIEGKLHRFLADFQLTGEWFDATAFQMVDWSSLG